MIESSRSVIQWLVTDGIGLTGTVGDVTAFFLFDALKITILLIVVMFVMAIVRQFLPLERIRSFLTRRRLYGGDHLLASLFGAITPFCSCSSIPMFMGFLSAGIPMGVTFSFLITSPLVNEIALVLLFVTFGWKVTVVYAVSGIAIGVIGGMLLGKLNEREELAAFLFEAQTADMAARYGARSVLRGAWKETRQILTRIIGFVLLGTFIGSLIHGVVPQGFFENYLSDASWWGVPLAAVLAVPLYVNAAAAVPVLEALVAKGVALGTALSFMMASVGLSLPEALMLKRVMSLKLLGLFFGSVTVGIMLIGFLVLFMF